MNPTYALALYISLIIAIFVIILLVNVLHLKHIVNILFQELTHVQQDLIRLKKAEKEVVKNLISDSLAKNLFTEKLQPNQKRIKKLRRRRLFKKISQKLNSYIGKGEIFMGLNVLDKLGVVSLLIGLIFLVSVGFEYNWINTIGRVFLGLVISATFMLLGYLLKNRFPKLSSVLFGAGFASMIFTIFAAYYQYHLMSIGLSYALIALVIIVSIIISVATDQNEIAVITFLSGFLSPFSVNLIGQNYWILFSYLTLLNIGIVLFDYFRKSLLINIASYAFTFLIYAIWMIKEFLKHPESIPFWSAIIFLTIFYILIFIIVIINNVRENRKFIGIEFSLLISSTALYYTAGYIIIKKLGLNYAGIYTLWIAIVNYAFFLILYPRKGFDRRILNMFLAITFMFLALIIPVQYMGKSPTLVWAMQAVVLMFVSIKADLKGMKLGSIELTILTIGSLAFDLYNKYVSLMNHFIVNTGFIDITFVKTILAVASLFVNAALLKMDKYEYFGAKFIKKKTYKMSLIIVGIITLYISSWIELKETAMEVYDDPAVIKVYMSLLNYGILTLMALPALFFRKKTFSYVALGAFVIAYILYLSNYAFSWADLRNEYLLTIYISRDEFTLHYYSAFMLFIISIIGLKALKKLFPQPKLLSYFANLVAVAAIIIFISNELDNFIISRVYQPHLLIQDLLHKIHRIDYSLLWEGAALLLIVIGLATKYKELRTSGLVLFIVTIIKIAAFDYSGLNNEQLMILFIGMGLTMLFSSIAYQFFNRKQLLAQAQDQEKKAAGL